MASLLVGPSTSSRPNDEPFINILRKMAERFSQAWIWIQARKTARLDSRRLCVIESLSLGEKRFVSVLQVDKQQFLIGTSSTGVALLASLEVSRSFDDVLQDIPSTQEIHAQHRGQKPKPPIWTVA
jgi:hypothetical protein